MANKKSKRKVPKTAPKKLTLKQQRRKFLADAEAHRQRTAPLKRGLEDQLLKRTLAETLALYILRNSDLPTNLLVRELNEIEFQAGEFVGRAHKLMKKQSNPINFKGALANALPFIALSGSDLMKSRKPKSKRLSSGSYARRKS